MARTRWNGRAWRVALAMIWLVALATAAVDAAADCAVPRETAQLTLTSVTIDGAEADASAYTDGTEPVTLSAGDPGVELSSESYWESFNSGVAP